MTTYLSIGHNHETPFDSWILFPGDDDLTARTSTDPKYSTYAEDLHGEYDGSRYDFKGRADHHKKAVSVTSGGGSHERLTYLVTVLKITYPGYTIHYFTTSTSHKTL